MKTSILPILQKPNIIVLTAGHGDGDPGAVDGSHAQAPQTISITNAIASILKKSNIDVRVSPHSQDLGDSINWVNKRFNYGDAWILEIHRDSATGLDMDDASKRCGIYYGVSNESKKVGEFIRQSFISHDAHKHSWCRPDTESEDGKLGWIRETKPVAHLLELGFMQGRNDNEHLYWLASVAAHAIFEAFTGNKLKIDQITNNDQMPFIIPGNY